MFNVKGRAKVNMEIDSSGDEFYVEDFQTESDRNFTFG